MNETTDEEAVVVTDEAPAYLGMPRKHRVIKHSVKQFVDGMAHTNGIESFGAGLKRGYVGVYHQISSKHLNRYVKEFAGRHNSRPFDTTDQMTAMAHAALGKRLRYKDLIGPKEDSLSQWRVGRRDMAKKRKPHAPAGKTSRPPRPMPERIDATPEEIAKAMFNRPADHECKFSTKNKSGSRLEEAP